MMITQHVMQDDDQEYYDVGEGENGYQLVVVYEPGVERVKCDGDVELKGVLENVSLGGKSCKSSYANPVLHLHAWRCLPPGQTKNKQQ